MWGLTCEEDRLVKLMNTLIGCLWEEEEDYTLWVNITDTNAAGICLSYEDCLEDAFGPINIEDRFIIITPEIGKELIRIHSKVNQ